jgi:hypothetical protein
MNGQNAKEQKIKNGSMFELGKSAKNTLLDAVRYLLEQLPKASRVRTTPMLIRPRF